jgi:hypothetical protein
MTIQIHDFYYYTINGICTGIGLYNIYHLAKTTKKKYYEIQDEKPYDESLTAKEKCELIGHIALTCLSFFSTLSMSISLSQESYNIFSSKKALSYIKTNPPFHALTNSALSLEQFDQFLKMSRLALVIGYLGLGFILFNKEHENPWDNPLLRGFIFSINLFLGNNLLTPNQNFIAIRISDSLIKAFHAISQNEAKLSFPTVTFNRELSVSIPEKWHRDDILSRYICPITQSPIRCPLILTHAGRLYYFEKYALIKWAKLSRKGNLFKNPLTQEWTTINKISFNPNFLRKIETRIKELQEEEKIAAI